MTWSPLPSLLVLASCSWGGRELHAAEDPRHVVVISMDTTRADALGPWGGQATPSLDALALEGVVFAHAMSAAPTTLASHTSLMTGRYPHHHGVPRNGFRVHARNDMLAEVLSDAGFVTAAFLGAIPLGTFSDFPQGFDHVDEEQALPHTAAREQAERPGRLVTDAALRWLDARPGDERRFLFVHYFDAHAPYEPAPPFGDGLERLAEDQGSLPHIERTVDLLRRRDPRGARHSAVLQALYRAEVRSVDAEVGRLVTGLRARGLLDQTLLVVTADHGEAFDSHPAERWDHGTTVYDETVHVPLLVRLPRGERGGTRIDAGVSTVDLFPTVLDLLDLPGADVDGRSLVPALRGEAFEARPRFAEATQPFRPQNPDADWHNDWTRKVIDDDGYTLHFEPRTGRTELYARARDPGQLRDVSRAEPAVAGRLGEELARWREGADPLASEKVGTPDLREQLEALGYAE